MKSDIVTIYQKYRAEGSMFVGHAAECAYRSAKTYLRFRDLQDRGLVRIHAEPECEPYDDSYLDTWPRLSDRAKEWIRKDLWRQIDREGCWTYSGQWRASEDDAWEYADSIGGIIGTDLVGYGPDLMQSAIDALEAHWASDAREMGERATYASV